MKLKAKIRSALPNIIPSLVFYAAASMILLALWIFAEPPKGAHVPSLHLIGLIGMVFISAFLGFKNAMSSGKASNSAVLVHTLAMLIEIAVLCI